MRRVACILAEDEIGGQLGSCPSGNPCVPEQARPTRADMAAVRSREATGGDKAVLVNPRESVWAH